MGVKGDQRTTSRGLVYPSTIGSGLRSNSGSSSKLSYLLNHLAHQHMVLHVETGCSPAQPGLSYVAKDDLELLTFLLLPQTLAQSAGWMV